MKHHCLFLTAIARKDVYPFQKHLLLDIRELKFSLIHQRYLLCLFRLFYWEWNWTFLFDLRFIWWIFLNWFDWLILIKLLSLSNLKFNWNLLLNFSFAEHFLNILRVLYIHFFCINAQVSDIFFSKIKSDTFLIIFILVKFLIKKHCWITCHFYAVFN